MRWCRVSLRAIPPSFLCPPSWLRPPVVSSPETPSLAQAHFLKCPDLYCCEGPGSAWPCEGISPCARNRTGPLCSHCLPGMTEVFGTPTCIPDEQCDSFQVCAATTSHRMKGGCVSVCARVHPEPGQVAGV